MSLESSDSVSAHGASCRRSLIEDAIASWVIATMGAGYAADDVLWTDYEQPRPDGAYLALRLSNLRQIGQDWVEVKNAASPAAGAEIVSTVWGKRAATLTIQAIAGEVTGFASPSEVLETIRLRSRLPSVRDALNRDGVGIATFGPVQTMSGTLSASAFEPRAIMTVELNLMASVAEFGTFVETVEITNEITDDEYEVEVP